MDDSVDWAANAQTEYIGPPGHEKKMYQTHFMVKGKKKLTGESRGRWVRIGEGRYKLVY